MNDRFERQVVFFGKPGQDALRRTSVAVVGVGGTGSRAVYGLAMLGIGRIWGIDPQEVELSNRNRLFGSIASDPIPGTLKTAVAKRAVGWVDPSIDFIPVPSDLRTRDAFDAIKAADWVFGCVDRDGARLVLTELCSAYDKPYVDIATEIIPDATALYGGRVFVASKGAGCLVCRGELDSREASTELQSAGQRADAERIYGVPRSALEGSGPSVAPLNGILVEHALLEFMLTVTGIRAPISLMKFYGHRTENIMTVNRDTPLPDCYYCKTIRGRGADAGVERYLIQPRVAA
jgi:hypothetical protein